MKSPIVTSSIITCPFLDFQRGQSRGEKNGKPSRVAILILLLPDIESEAQPKATRFRTKAHDRAVQSAARRQFAVQENQVERVDIGSGKDLTVSTI